MTHEYTRREVDYDVMLTDRVRVWESEHRAIALALRLEVQRKLGMHRPPTSRGGLLVLEQQFREAVRVRNGWVSLAQWMRGEE